MEKRRTTTVIIIIMMMFSLMLSYNIGYKTAAANQKPKIEIKHDTVYVEDTIKYAKFPYTISNEGREHIKSYEKCKLTAYFIRGQKTIGWGHLIKKGENYNVISQAKADQLFNIDIKLHEVAMNRLLEPFAGKFKFTQGFIDGFGSLVYNCGEGGVKRTEFYKRLSKSRYDKSINNINELDYNFTISAVKTTAVTMKGHIKRRQAEYEMMII